MKQLLIKCMLIAISALGCTYADAKADIKNEINEVVSELKSLPQDKLKFVAKDFSSFVQNIQNISPEMSPEEIEKLLGKPTKKYSHGQFKFHNPDLFTFFRYELLTTISPKPFYCVTIMFSKNKGKILSVYSDTNLPLISKQEKYWGQYVNYNSVSGEPRRCIGEIIMLKNGTITLYSHQRERTASFIFKDNYIEYQLGSNSGKERVFYDLSQNILYKKKPGKLFFTPEKINFFPLDSKIAKKRIQEWLYGKTSGVE